MPHPYQLQRETRAGAAGKPRAATAKAKKDFVTWSEGEKLDIAQKSLDLMAANPDMPMVDTVREAVATLPVSRQKPIKDMAHTAWIKPIWEKLAADADARNEAAQAPAPAPAPVPEPVPQVLTDETPAKESGKGKRTEAQREQMRQSALKARAAMAAKRASGEAGPMKRWKPAEWHTLAKAMVKREREQPEEKVYERFLFAMRSSLPADRQRDIRTYFIVERHITPFLDTARHELELAEQANAAHIAEQRAEQERNEAEMREQTERLEVEARERQEREQAENQEAQERARQIAYVAEQSAAAARVGAVEEYVENVTLDQIFALMARKMARAILPVVMQEIKNEFAKELGGFIRPGNVTKAPLHSPVMESPPAAPKKPRVFVLGGRGEWHRDIQSAFDSKLDLSFSKGSNEGDREFGYAARADLVIVCSDAIPHKDVESLRKIRGENFERVDGGSSSVKRRLSLYLSERGKSAAH